MAPRKKPDESVFKFEQDGKPYEIDTASLTWGEIEDLEVHFECSYDEVDFNSGRGTMFLQYLARRRLEPTWTLDALRALPVATTTNARTEAPDPTGGGATSGTPS